MKIMSKKNVSEPKAIVECRCGTKFECNKNDGQFISDQRDGDCIKVKCPSCPIEHWISVDVFR